MKNKLLELLHLLDAATQHFPQLLSTKEILSKGAAYVGNTGITHFAASLDLSNIETSLKHLDQFLDKKLVSSENEKVTIINFSEDLRKNVDNYSERLSYLGDNFIDVFNGGTTNDIKVLINDVVDDIIRSCKTYILHISA